MIRITTDIEFEKMQVTDKCKMECIICHSYFFIQKRTLLNILNNTGKHSGVGLYCSHKCVGIAKSQKCNTISTECAQCGKQIIRTRQWFKSIKNAFCSKSCAATYNNTHKKTGSRKSKLEVWLQSKLDVLYPNLEITYCDKTAIQSELDIYIPSLKLAFELNGIYHYEPIHGQNKLDQIQNNDNRKFQACIENNIELVLIDVSTLKYFKEQNCQKYLDIITTIISQK